MSFVTLHQINDFCYGKEPYQQICLARGHHLQGQTNHLRGNQPEVARPGDGHEAHTHPHLPQMEDCSRGHVQPTPSFASPTKAIGAKRVTRSTSIPIA